MLCLAGDWLPVVTNSARTPTWSPDPDRFAHALFRWAATIAITLMIVGWLYIEVNVLLRTMGY
jgi:hypothetical protein